MRSEIANALLGYVDIKSNEGGKKRVKEQRKKKDKEDLDKLTKLIKSTINHFQQRKQKDYIFNLKTEKKVTKLAETYILNVMKEGKRQKYAFFPHVKKTLIDLRNPFARYKSKTSKQLTFLRGIIRNKLRN